MYPSGRGSPVPLLLSHWHEPYQIRCRALTQFPERGVFRKLSESWLPARISVSAKNRQCAPSGPSPNFTSELAIVRHPGGGATLLMTPRSVLKQATDPERQALLKLRAVGYITALIFALHPRQQGTFERSLDVGCYLGIRPQRSPESGTQQPSITASGAGYDAVIFGVELVCQFRASLQIFKTAASSPTIIAA